MHHPQMEQPQEQEYFKFCEIENVSRQVAVETAIQGGYTTGEWVVTEKVHGANFCYIVTEEQVKYGKRNGWTDTTFFNCASAIQRYHDRARDLFQEVKQMAPTLKTLRIFGELYGGYYNDETRVPYQKCIQTGVYYNPVNDFYAFDIHYTLESDEQRWMKYNNAIELFKKHSFFYAEPLFIGSFEEAMAFDQVFTTTLPTRLGLQPLEKENLSEGVVIKPMVPIITAAGMRVIFKKKNEIKFPEKTPAKPAPKDQDFSEAVLKLIAEAESYVTEHRLDSVISKEGKIGDKTKFLFMQDVLQDFYKNFEHDYEMLNPDSQAYLKRKLGLVCSKMIDERKKKQELTANYL